MRSDNEGKTVFFSSFVNIIIILIGFNSLRSYHRRKDHAPNLTESAELMRSLRTRRDGFVNTDVK